MRFVQCVGDLRPEVEWLFEWKRVLFEAFGQRFPLDAFHSEIINAVLMTDIMQGANIRMIQAGNGLRFALEALLANRIRGELRGQNFDRDGALQPRVAGAVNFAHAPRTKRHADFIRAKLCTWGERHTYP